MVKEIELAEGRRMKKRSKPIIANWKDEKTEDSQRGKPWQWLGTDYRLLPKQNPGWTPDQNVELRLVEWGTNWLGSG